MLFSTRTPVRWFGAANLAAVCLLAWFNSSGLISLWCVWAAITSVVIAMHLRAASEPSAVHGLVRGKPS